MLVTVIALGIGPASFLGARFDAAARLAIAAPLGLCVGTCVFTTLIWFTSARHTYWLIPILATISIVCTLRRTAGGGQARRGLRAKLGTLSAYDALALVVVCIATMGPLTYTLHERHSVGPVSFLIGDAAGYVEEADGAVQESLSEAVSHQPKTVSPTLAAWRKLVASPQNLDAAPLAANLNELGGFGSTETQSSYMIVFLAVAALGAFATVRYFAPRPKWASPLAGVLFGGPLFLQLLADGSQAAICGIALMAPIAAVGAETLRNRRVADLALLALLAAGLMALYGLYVPGVAVASAIVLVVRAINRRRSLSPQTLRSAAGRIAVVIGLTAIFNFVSVTRNVRFWTETANFYSAGRPKYDLPITVLPGWLLQTRQFFLLGGLFHGSLFQLLLGILLPIVFVAAMIMGIRRWHFALLCLSLIFTFAALAEYTSAAHNCSYCVDRNLLPVAPLTIVLLALGTAALASVGSAWLQGIAVVIALLSVVAAGYQTRSERLLFAADSYFLEDGNRELLSHLPRHPGPVDLEGYGLGQHGVVPELTDMYSLMAERNHEEVSVPNEFPSPTEFKSLGTENYVDPNYRYVLTRFGGVRTARRIIARVGPLALEERVSKLDVTFVSGATTPLVRLDKSGLPQIEGRLHLLVVGSGSGPAWVSLRFRTIVRAEAIAAPGLSEDSASHTLTVCALATGAGPLRRLTIKLRGRLFPGADPAEPFGEEEPPQGIQLVAMHVAAHCSTGSPSHGQHRAVARQV